VKQGCRTLSPLQLRRPARRPRSSCSPIYESVGDHEPIVSRHRHSLISVTSASRHLSARRPADCRRSGGKLAGDMREMPPASDTIDPRARREIETYGVIERTVDGAIERTADGLNPLTINHTAKTISWRPIGMLSTVSTVVKPKSWVNPA
jgi:hypothetical protein